MAKTRRKKINRSPDKPFRNAKAYVALSGDRMTVKGVRGKTRVGFTDGMRARIVEIDPQIIAKPVGDRKPKPVFVGRQYTGVARSKVYPYAGVKRGGSATLIPVGLMARAAKAVRAVKRVVVKDKAGA